MKFWFQDRFSQIKICKFNFEPVQVPEINGHMVGKSKLIANPNCTTAIAAVVLWPLHREFGIQKIIMSTYQAASGAGSEVLCDICSLRRADSVMFIFFVSTDAQGMEELLSGTKAVLAGEPASSTVFAHPLPFNLIPQIDKFQVINYPCMVNVPSTYRSLFIFFYFIF
jgi:aspartate-semialdehyde dehydrogenase